MAPRMLVDDLNLLGSYLARRDIPVLDLKNLGAPVEWIVLLGSSLLGPIRVAAEAFHRGCSKGILICGGIGHSTQDLRNAVRSHSAFQKVETENRAEADIIHEILMTVFEINADALLVENKSTNCGSNAVEAHRLLSRTRSLPSRLVLIQDPTMQRRSHESFVRAWAGEPARAFVSFAPFAPLVEQTKAGYQVKGDIEGTWTFDRFVSLVLGEVLRLRDDENGYGPKGKNFIDHVEVPPEILDAYERVATNFQVRQSA